MNSRYECRKDCFPKQTIERIEKILASLGLKINIVQEIHHRNLWFSCYVEIDGFPGIGANGKGVSLEYAYASAYSEIMERLQSGTLFGGYFPNKKVDNLEYFSSNSEAITSYRRYLKRWVSGWSEDTLITLLKNSKSAMKIDRYYDLFDKKIVSLPGRMIDFLSGTNGIAAGNSPAEALVQGVCEIFERYVLSRIYSKTCDLRHSFSYIQLKCIEKLPSFEMIAEIQHHGYECRLIDCTLNNTFPVIGLLVLNSTKSKYMFTLASDINIDICIQRCITEMFQGRWFDARFRTELQTSLHYDYSPNYDNNIMHHEFLKSYRDHSGKLPFGMFMLNEKCMNIGYPFLNQCKTNEVAFQYIHKILALNNMDTYIHDCSFLGYPTFRIYIPGYSDILFDNNTEVFDVIIAQQIIKSGIESSSLLEKYEATKKLFANSVTSSHTPNDYIGVMLFPDTIKHIGLDSYESLLTKLSVALEKWEEAYMYADISSRYHYNDIIARIRKIAIIAVSNKINEEQFIHDMKQYVSPEIAATVFHEISDTFEWFVCGECAECRYKEKCMYKNYNQLDGKLLQQKRSYTDTFLNEIDILLK